MRRFVLVSMVACVLSTVLSPAAASASEILLRPPTDAAVAEPFNLPDGPYGAGNRGIDYATSVGNPIVASGPGIVVFAGPVAGSLHATIDHGGGLLTSYSYVKRLLVTRGDQVDAGDLIAISGEGFHFGARIEHRYVDPETLFGVRSVRVALVPRPDPRTRAAWLDIASRSEVIEYLEMDARRGGWGVGDLLGGLRDAASAVTVTPLRWLDPVSRIAELGDIALSIAVLIVEVRPEMIVARSALIVVNAVSNRDCTDRSVVVPVPTERRLAVVVDGLNSSSSSTGAMAALDLRSHGYADGDIVRFSYSGGRVAPADPANTDGWLSDIAATTYSDADTRSSVEDNVLDLEDLLQRVSVANPGVKIDVYGHSLGGLLTRLAVADVGGDGGSVDIGVAVTFGAPNHGVPLAEVVQAFRLTTPGSVLAAVTGIVSSDSLLVSDAIDDLSPSGLAGRTRNIGFPPGVHAVSIGGRGDLVVPGTTTGAPGARNVIIGHSIGRSVHSELPGLPEADREVALALGGLSPACESRWNRLADGAVSLGIENLERAVAVGEIVMTVE